MGILMGSYGTHWMTWMMAFDSWIYDVAFVVLGPSFASSADQADVYFSEEEEFSEYECEGCGSKSVRPAASIVVSCAMVFCNDLHCSYKAGMRSLQHQIQHGFVACQRMAIDLELWIYAYLLQYTCIISIYTHIYIYITDQTRNICRPSVRKR